MRDIRYITEDLENNYKGNSRKYKLYIYTDKIFMVRVLCEKAIVYEERKSDHGMCRL